MAMRGDAVDPTLQTGQSRRGNGVEADPGRRGVLLNHLKKLRERKEAIREGADSSTNPNAGESLAPPVAASRVGVALFGATLFAAPPSVPPPSALRRGCMKSHSRLCPLAPGRPAASNSDRLQTILNSTGSLFPWPSPSDLRISSGPGAGLGSRTRRRAAASRSAPSGKVANAAAVGIEPALSSSWRPQAPSPAPLPLSPPLTWLRAVPSRNC